MKTVHWEKFFDRVFCIYYLPNKVRMPRLKNELGRVGLLDSPVFEWRFTTPSPYDKVVQDSYQDKKWINSIGCMNVALETNRILKESLLLGYKKILVLEDDVAFLKDLNRLNTILENIPEGYDVVQLDKGCWGLAKVREWKTVCRNEINSWFVDSGKSHFGLSSANVFMVSGMRMAIGILDKKPIACDQLNVGGIFKWAVAKENACIQILFSKSNYNNGVDCHCIYRDIGLEYSNYAVPDGYGYGMLYSPMEDGAVGVTKKGKSNAHDGERGRWDAFDYVGVVCYTGYKDRAKELMKELQRVGLDGKAHLHWDVPSPFRDRLFSAVKKSPFCSRGACFYMMVAHYNIIKVAYELGSKSVLVIEDDIRFLKDCTKIDELLSAIPFDFDHLMLDRNKLSNQERSDFSKIGERKMGWYQFSELGSTGCYAMSRRGMKRYIELVEEDIVNGMVRNPDYYFRSGIDGRVFWDSSYRRYFSYPNIAVQEIVGKGGSFSDLSDYWRNIGDAGIKQGDYNLDCPIVTDFNIEELSRIIPKGDSDVHCDNELLGFVPNKRNKEVLQKALQSGEPIVIRAADMDSAWAAIEVDNRDTVESMLNDFHLIVTPEQRLEARCLIDKIVANKISGYFPLMPNLPQIGNIGHKKVLVVDDFSKHENISLDEMIEVAITENPDCDVLIKTKQGTTSVYGANENIFIVDLPINHYTLIDLCDKVYVCSSKFGLEALMAGKEVHVFGMPFYAGWGLTIDDQHLDRRTNMRTLEELFYIFYCMYTHWIDPDKGCETTIDAVIDKMIKLREGHQKNPHEATRAAATPYVSDDGFGYVRRSPSVRTPFVPQPNPPISSRSSIKVLPRIGGMKRVYTNW